MSLCHGSVPQVDAEEELAVAGIRCEVDESVEVLVAEIVELWIEAPIVGLHPEVASLDRDAHVGSASELSPSLWSLERDVHFAKLHIAAEVNVGRDVARAERAVAELAEHLLGVRRSFVVVA